MQTLLSWEYLARQAALSFSIREMGKAIRFAQRQRESQGGWKLLACSGLAGPWGLG